MQAELSVNNFIPVFEAHFNQKKRKLKSETVVKHVSENVDFW